MRYIAFLRGINVGGNRIIPMQELKKLFEDLGFIEVETYIQSGNVVFSSEKVKLEILTNGIKERFSFDIIVIVKTARELEKIIENNPFPESDKLGFMLLSKKPDKLEKLTTVDGKGEMIEIIDDVAYVVYSNGMGRAVYNNNFIEKILGVKATTRNLRTMKKLLSICSK